MHRAQKICQAEAGLVLRALLGCPDLAVFAAVPAILQVCLAFPLKLFWGRFLSPAARGHVGAISLAGKIRRLCVRLEW